MKRLFAGALVLAAAAVFGDADWTRLNADAREQAKSVIRAGEPGVRPFWNGHSKAFIHPPAFEFKDIPGATSYRFTLEPEDKALKPSVWIDSRPWKPVDASIWDSLVPGYYTIRVEALDAAGASIGLAGTRRFWRAAVFHGPYPQAHRTFREAARRVYAAIYALPYVQAWLESNEPPVGYDLYCYPAKILSAMIIALCRHASLSGDADEKSRSLAIACRMADWLIAQSQPAEAPLAHFPPTYWGDRRSVSVKNAGLNMLCYPAHAAIAYFSIADALVRTGAADRAMTYRRKALAIVSTYVRLQEKDGTWPLKVRESDGKPTRANRLVPYRYIFGMFDSAIAAGGDGGTLTVARLKAARAAAFAFLERGPLVTWNWDGQFEDMDPMPPYVNLQKGSAIDTAIQLFALGRKSEAQEVVDWCEDQFTVWSDPLHHMDWRNWRTPTALEQYDYYTPIDASMADMIRGFTVAFTATGDPLYRAKALALANCLVRHQRANGTIPTYFDSRRGSDWANCMIYAASALEFAADRLEKKKRNNGKVKKDLVPSFAATGFWHVKRIDGRDWAIAPDGRATVLAGVDWVWPAGFHCEELGYSPYGRFVETNYPSREVWADETAARLKKWGFNFLGSGCDDKLLAPHGFAHTAMLNVGYRLSHDADKEKAIAPGLHRPGSAFPNVFHPDFASAWDRAAARAAAKYRNERNLLGYYLDNELSWGGISRNRDEGMFDAAASYPDSHSAKKALLAFLKEKGWDLSKPLSSVSREIKVAFLSLVAERYFSVAAGALRRHDPNHMVLGCRFAGLGAHEVVLKAAARHCDIVTFNYYPWADLDRGIVLDRRDGRPIADVFREFHAKVGAPLLITEWSFSALDAGRPCSDGAGQRFRTQAERVEAAELFARTLLSLPFMVGHAWFMWVDQPALGFNKYFHEDCNYGLVGEDGKPYQALTKMFTRLHAAGPKLRVAPMKPHKTQVKRPEVRLSEHDRFFRKARRDAGRYPKLAPATFSNDGTNWTLSNSAGIRLSGSVGAPSMVNEVERDGRIYGRLGARIMTTAPDWPPVTRLSSVKGSVDPKTGCASVILEGVGGRGPAFSVALRLTLAPNDPDILAEVISVKNIGSEPLSVMKVFLCPVAGGPTPPVRVPMPVNVWKGWNESHWRLADGARYGAISYDESADGFNLWTEANGQQHADIPFRPKAIPVTLAPGELLEAPRAMGARLILSHMEKL